MKRLLIPLTAALAVFAITAPSALASTRQVSLVLDNPALNANPMKTLTTLHAMGVTMVKYAVYWNLYSPNSTSSTAPAGATTSGIYQAYNKLGGLDEIDRDAASLGIKVGLEVTAPAPRWAEANGGTASQEKAGTYKPSSADFQAFVEALGQRYSGSYKPAGSTTPLPAVKWWSVWNEPNYIVNLSPQTVGATTYESADIYRSLVNAEFAGLKATGHAGNTFLFGEVAPRGIASTKAGNGAGIKPLQFLASVYCVSTAGKRLSGKVATANGCPSSASKFKSANPGLFDATGVADHPYAQGTAPNVPTYDCGAKACQNAKTKKSDPLWTDLASISHLENGLGKDLKAYGSGKEFAIWNTEFGYWVVPNKTTCHNSTQADCAVSATEAAYYDNWAEYVSYKNPRIADFGQYQLLEPPSGSWTDGLLSASGAIRPAYNAFEVPLYMPKTSLAKAGKLTVWGGARSVAVLAASASKVEIQFKAKSGGWKTLKTMKVSGIGGYFTTSVSFGQSGSVRLVYPVGRTSIIGRTQAITVK